MLVDKVSNPGPTSALEFAQGIVYLNRNGNFCRGT